MSAKRVHRLRTASEGDGTQTPRHRVLAGDAEDSLQVVVRTAVGPGTEQIVLALAELLRDRWAAETLGGDKVVAFRGVQSECRVVNGSPDLLFDEPA